MDSKIYLAYGSNMDTTHMRQMCPAARLLGPAWLDGFRLAFRSANGVTDVTIEACEAERVPALLWEVTPADEAALDEYEEYPRLYCKSTVSVGFHGQTINAMVYLLNGGCRTSALPEYIALIRKGYEEAGFDSGALNLALEEQRR